LDTFDKILKANPDNPNLRFEIGERYRRLAERRFNPEKHEVYFKYAVELFEQSQKLFDATMSPPPCQSVYSRAFLYDNLGYYEKAIEMWEEIIMRNKRDYNNAAEYESNEWPREMIEALKNKIAQRGK
jgi:tetratricopeptide (TPR) repeat protein